MFDLLKSISIADCVMQYTIDILLKKVFMMHRCFFYVLMMFSVIDVESMTGTEGDDLFIKYLDRLDIVSGHRLANAQRYGLTRPRTMKDYNANFVKTKEYGSYG